MKDLRVLRAERRMSQEDVANAIGIHRVTYNNIENGRTIPLLPTAIKLAELFETELTEIQFGKKE